MNYFGMTSTQEVLLKALWALMLMPVFGFLGAVFLNWSQLLLDARPIRYWTAYKVTTLASMAAVVFLVPVQLMTNRLGFVGLAIDVALSVVVLAFFYARWIRIDNVEPISLGDAAWLSAFQTGLWLLVTGVFFGLGAALKAGQTLPGVALAVFCAALLAMAASVSLRRPASGKAPPAVDITWKTEDILALHRHAAEQLDRGERDDELWALAAIARPDAAQRRDWYLAERVKKLKEIAEEQLRREGIL